MERFCNRCGSLVTGDVKFCPNCGELMQGAVDLGKADAMPPAGQNYGYGVQPNYGNQPIERSGYGYSTPQYGNNNNNIAPGGAQNGTMTTSQWLGTIILCTFFGMISLVLNIVWGFGSNTPEPKRSFCRAMLIVNIIGYVLATFVSIFFLAIFGSEFSEIISWGL